MTSVSHISWLTYLMRNTYFTYITILRIYQKVRSACEKISYSSFSSEWPGQRKKRWYNGRKIEKFFDANGLKGYWFDGHRSC